MSDEMCAFLSIVCSLSVGIYLYVCWFILGKNRTRCFIEKAKKWKLYLIMKFLYIILGRIQKNVLQEILGVKEKRVA